MFATKQNNIMDIPEKLPRHVSFIMDGNGRWAKSRGLERIQGHFEGVESVRAVLETSVELGIEYVSVFAFSEENWGRPDDEVAGLMTLMMKSMIAEKETFLRNGVHFKVLGNRERLSAELNEAIDYLDGITADGSRTTLIIFLSYSGQWDIRQAAEKMAAAGTGSIEDYLVTAGIPDPDLPY